MTTIPVFTRDAKMLDAANTVLDRAASRDAPAILGLLQKIADGTVEPKGASEVQATKLVDEICGSMRDVMYAVMKNGCFDGMDEFAVKSAAADALATVLYQCVHQQKDMETHFAQYFKENLELNMHSLEVARAAQKG